VIVSKSCISAITKSLGASRKAYPVVPGFAGMRVLRAA
jgi:hypothetical protein